MSGLLKPYWTDGQVTIYHGDCREIMPALDPVDAVVTDPPYGDTSLDWDRAPVADWAELAAGLSRSLWCFGSLKFHMGQAATLDAAGWRYGQEIVWEKHNGSGFHADRFKRVHEIAVHRYRGPWKSLYRRPPVTMDATPRTVRRKKRPTHTGHIEASSYTSEDGGPRLMRSVIQCRSEHGRAVHPTQKPLGIMRPLVQYSVPPGGTVLDPFAGSGSTLLAARDLSRTAIGIEIDEGYCASIVERMAQGAMVFDPDEDERLEREAQEQYAAASRAAHERMSQANKPTVEDEDSASAGQEGRR